MSENQKPNEQILKELIHNLKENPNQLYYQTAINICTANGINQQNQSTFRYGNPLIVALYTLVLSYTTDHETILREINAQRAERISEGVDPKSFVPIHIELKRRLIQVRKKL